MQMKLVSQRVERMIRGDHLGESKARKPHEAAAAAPAREVIDELDRGAIAPMQVLGHQQQRTALGVTVQEFAHLTEHPFQVDADKLSQQGFALFHGTEPGQLQQPGRRDGAQQRWYFCISAAQLREGFENRMVRLAASVVLHAMATRASNVAEPGDKAIDQRGFANPGLAGDPEYDALATPHAVPGAAKRCEFFCSTDE